MASITLPKGQTFIVPQKKITALYLIKAGEVRISYHHGSYLLKKGDIIGILELTHKVHQFTYTSMTSCIFESFAYPNIDSLYQLLTENAPLAHVSLRSCISQFHALTSHYAGLTNEASRIYRLLLLDYKMYKSYCTKYCMDIITLEALDDLHEFASPISAENWQEKMCTQLIEHPEMPTNAGILIAMMKEMTSLALTYVSAIHSCYEYLTYKYSIAANHTNEDLIHLFETILELPELAATDRNAIINLLKNRIEFSSNSSVSDSNLFAQKLAHLNAYALTTSMMQKPSIEVIEETFEAELSLERILEFSTLADDIKETIHNTVESYKKYASTNVDDDNCTKLRSKLTELFYLLYEDVFFQTLSVSYIPPTVMMFLSFGYIDETLSGIDNAKTLSSFLTQLKNFTNDGVYTLYQWLILVHRGEKEPSRNAFDEDYTTYVHNQLTKGNITKEEEHFLLNDKKEKTIYELRNMFPTVTKIAFGRISIYCPIFTESQLTSSFTNAFISQKTIDDLLTQVETTDAQVFARPSFITLEDLNQAKFEINPSIRPDIILMPCIGTRGVMWQEIEGRRRTSPARMMFPIFHLENLESSFLHVIGEYRWEICKRIQGARWNDVSEHSLTSDYCDFLQFYKKNHDLSPEAKEKLKSSLLKARNNFKELFAREYITWITAESQGSPRLNKITRNIFFTHCPFSATIREKLTTSPLYAESLQRYEIKMKQKLHKCQNIITKYQAINKPLPQEVADEFNFIQK